MAIVSLTIITVQIWIIKDLTVQIDWMDETYSELVTLHSELIIKYNNLKPTRILKVKSKSKTNKITIK